MILFFIGILIGGLVLLLASIIYVRKQRQEDQEYKIALTDGLGFTKTHLPSYNKGYADGYKEGYTKVCENYYNEEEEEEEEEEKQEEKINTPVGWIKISKKPLKLNSSISFYSIISFNIPYGYN